MIASEMKDGEMTEFLRWSTITHSQRLHAHRHTAGYGHIYQGRFKSFTIEQDTGMENYCSVAGLLMCQRTGWTG
jgi:putative transposase